MGYAGSGVKNTRAPSARNLIASSEEVKGRELLEPDEPVAVGAEVLVGLVVLPCAAVSDQLLVGLARVQGRFA